LKSDDVALGSEYLRIRGPEVGQSPFISHMLPLRTRNSILSVLEDPPSAI